MKDLRLLSMRAFETSDLPTSPWFCVQAHLNPPILFLFHAKSIYKVDLSTEQVVGKYDLDVLGDDVHVVGLTYTTVWEKLYVALDIGEVATLELEEINYVGSVESGIKAMEWSVDESLVVLVSGNDKVMILSSDFDPITGEIDLHQEGFEQFVNVGWGKKETQFHGSEGKAAAQARLQIDENPANECDDRLPRIRWRGDGALFAVSFIRYSGARQIRIFNREGVLQFTSEPTIGLEQSLDWKLSGSVIASTIMMPNKQIVAFFEKNGLRHGEFTLPFQPNEVEVKELRWNLDSSILAIWCVYRESKKSCLQLWAASNYNWQLKQSLNFPPGKRLLNFSWDKELIYNLHVIQEGPVYIEYVWKWEIDHSSGQIASDFCSVAVIDGANVKMTNLREAVVPPPMCSYNLNLQNPVSCVAFSTSSNFSNDVCIITNENEVAKFTLNGPITPSKSISVVSPDDGMGFDKSGSKLVPTSFHKLEWGKYGSLKFKEMPSSLHHWLWISENALVCAFPAEKHKSYLLKLELEAESEKATVVSAVPVDSTIKGLCLLPQGGGVVANLADDVLKIWECNDQPAVDFSTNVHIQFKYLSTCVQFDVFEVESNTHVIGRSLLGILYLDNVDVIKNCSSYFIHSNFILITNSENKLLCIPKTKDGIESLLSRSKVGADGTERQIEFGAVLVAAVACDTRVVLQMPRGNLEVIQPRALAIFIIKHLLDNKKYFDAFDIMRKQRINLNLIYDHNPALFLENIKEFVLQIKNPTWLCLFLTDLMETDVTESMYLGHYPAKTGFTLPSNTTKLDFVCSKMRETMLEVDRKGLVLPVISTFIKETKSNIGAALQCINKIKVEEQSGTKLPVSCDEALNYLFYIVDVYELFDVALGLYDFELVMLVAQKSQKDPKEYIPFLNELRKLEPHYQKFTIDKHLKKYESALVHIKECGPEHYTECKKFITDHKLYAAAVKVFTSTHALYQDICKEYGSNLMSGQYYQEAGIIFERAQCYKESIEAFRKAGCWRRIVPILAKLGWSKEKLDSFYEELGNELRERRQYLDSATVFGDYVNKQEERLISLCKAKAWDEACRVKCSYEIPGADQLLRFEVVNHQTGMLSDIETAREQITQYTSRLLAVRAEKAKRIEEGDDFANLPECDMFSDTSSIRGSTQSRSSGLSSRGTGRTYRSSKNKRKHERKLLSLKEGSPYEDLALVRALHELFSKIYSYREEVKNVCVALLQLNLDAEAADLQNKLSALLQDTESKKSAIWIPELAQNRAAALAALGPDGTSNSLSALNQMNPLALTAAAELDPHLCLPPVMPHSSWKLKILQ